MFDLLYKKVESTAHHKGRQNVKWLYDRPHPDPVRQKWEQLACVNGSASGYLVHSACQFSQRIGAVLPFLEGKGQGEGERLPKADSVLLIHCLSWAVLLLSTFMATAQTNAPPASYIRSYINDVPNEPLVSVAVTGASNVSCFTIEEDLTAPATALDVSGDGVYLPAQNLIRWGPYFNTVATNVSYRLTGRPAGYPVSGGAWMDGQWYFSPGVTTVNVLPVPGTSGLPTPPAAGGDTRHHPQSRRGGAASKWQL